MTFNLLRFKVIDSTNTYALKYLHQYADKTVVVADQQTKGRGRFDRRWVSDSVNNLYMSIILKPLVSDHTVESQKKIMTITPMTSLALAEVLQKYFQDTNFKLKIKWPNDVLVDEQKIAGILAETKVKGNVFTGIVVGVGINLDMSEKDLAEVGQPATALNILLQKKIDKEIFLKEFLEIFERNYELLWKKGFAEFRSVYEQKLHNLGQRIFIKTSKAVYTGVLEGVDAEGALQLRQDDGNLKLLYSGEEIG
ncbi:biotin--[acetyl-CoA-carboxylase] ligase [bacterium]|jgi:BirA family transcriptional regulator, biotin operon repressor / biotin---[acetyl-CoA-carboxylase] ligase|nr:biotin--[acetyl-CoA-carboxylase] ligase [bacterium]MBT7088206.1 biotin--[acetyl-CoA-carboxylase] ligase [bacterium]